METILFLSSLVILQLTFYILKQCKVSDKTLSYTLNIMRIVYSSLVSIFIVLQRNQLAYVSFLLLASTFTINSPKITILKKHKQQVKSKKVQVSVISDIYVVCSQLSALLLIQEPSYQKLINLYNKMPHVTQSLILQDQSQYSVKFYRLNAFVTYVSCFTDFILSIIPIIKQKKVNNMLNGMKNMIQLVAIFYILSDSVQSDLIKQSPNEALIDSFFIFNMILNLIQFFLLAFPKRFIANLLTFTNLCFGIIGAFYCIYVYLYYPQVKIYIYTPLCILLGQIADLFDGRAAERFGGTKNGALYDDIADFTSFGVATGAYIFKILRVNCNCNIILAICVTVFYIFSIIYRLIRFVIHKNAAGIKTGVRAFEGLPSPAGSSIVLSLNLFIEICDLKEKIDQKMLLSLYIISIVIISLLTVSYIKYPHFGRVILNSKRIPLIYKTILITLFISVILIAIIQQKFTGLLVYLLFACILYLLSPLYFDRIGMYQVEENVNDDTTDGISETQ